MAELPVDARIRELWKAVAITASEHDSSSTAVGKADEVTLAFVERFYPNDMQAGNTVTGVRKAAYND